MNRKYISIKGAVPTATLHIAFMSVFKSLLVTRFHSKVMGDSLKQILHILQFPLDGVRMRGKILPLILAQLQLTYIYLTCALEMG